MGPKSSCPTAYHWKCTVSNCSPGHLYTSPMVTKGRLLEEILIFTQQAQEDIWNVWGHTIIDVCNTTMLVTKKKILLLITLNYWSYCAPKWYLTGVSFFSRKLSLAKKYSGNWELHSLKLALGEYHHWIEVVHHPFSVFTDHKNRNIPTAFQPSNLGFSRFVFTIWYQPGLKNTKAESPSHAHMTHRSMCMFISMINILCGFTSPLTQDSLVLTEHTDSSRANTQSYTI